MGANSMLPLDCYHEHECMDRPPRLVRWTASHRSMDSGTVDASIDCCPLYVWSEYLSADCFHPTLASGEAVLWDPVHLRYYYRRSHCLLYTGDVLAKNGVCIRARSKYLAVELHFHSIHVGLHVVTCLLRLHETVSNGISQSSLSWRSTDVGDSNYSNTCPRCRRWDHLCTRDQWHHCCNELYWATVQRSSVHVRYCWYNSGVTDRFCTSSMDKNSGKGECVWRGKSIRAQPKTSQSSKTGVRLFLSARSVFIVEVP